ncbi:MAG: 50S ribosomal protein L19 [Planctomycetes bacterium]|nr:50S ribosomal protein L19 [Planctomycetota bacterium]
MSKAVAASLKTDLPDFEIGDTVNVSVRIIEGEKERVQVFTGIVISRKGTGIHETFTVRRIIAGEGVERTFPLNSPRVAGVEVIRKSHVRRAKLYFLRKRIGKATVLREKRRTLTQVQVPGAEQAAVDQAPTEQTTEA